MTKFAFAAMSILLTMISIPIAHSEDKSLVTFQSLTLETALDLARAGLEKCRSDGFQVTVSVVDRGGNLQVTLRDRFAGPHTPDTAYRKAWTALSFRTDTLELAQSAESGSSWGMRHVTKALPLGGGVQIREGNGSLVGAVGVSGAPAGDIDEACAKAGIEAIQDRIAF